MRRLLLVVLLAAPLAGHFACVPASETPVAPEDRGDDPETLARRFHRALRLDDPDELGRLFTERGLEGLRSGVGFRVDAETFDGWRVKRSRIEGAEAFVAVRTRIQDELQEVDLHFTWSVAREAWLIDGLKLFLPEVGELPIDFEDVGRYVRNAEGEDDETGATAEEKAWVAEEDSRRQRVIEAQRARFEALSPTTERKHENHWTMNLFGRQRSARAVIEEILEGTGIVVDETGSIAALEKPLGIELRGVSRIEALERVAAAIGLVPVYPYVEVVEDTRALEAPVLSFEPGARTSNARFEGPFLILVERLQEHVPLATGTLTLGIYALGLAPSVLAFQDRMFEHVQITKLVGPRGQDLEAEEDVQYLGRPSIQSGLFAERITVELAGLLRSVRRIGRIEGRVVLRLPRYVEPYRWPQTREDSRKLFGERTLELLEWGETSRFRMHGPAERVDRTELRFSPLTENYKPLELLFDDSFAVGGELTASLQADETPLRLDVKVCTVDEVRYPFSIQNIALERHEDMPVSLERLTFEGDLPVVARFLRFQKRGDVPEIRIRLLNTSNKDATRIATEVRYLDENGRVIGAFPHTWVGPESEQPASSETPWTPRYVVARGMMLEETRPALFMPKKTAHVRVEVQEIEFSDGTRWPKR